MKRVFSLFALLIAVLSCQTIAQAQAASETNGIINEGTTARISLQNQLSSKLSEVGDEVIGVLYEAVRSSDGRVAIPRGTEFVADSAKADGAKAVFSIDGGKSYSPQPTIEEKQADGSVKRKPAPVSMYTDVRYEWADSLAQGGKVTASYRVRVK